ncbi:hypothetical protein BST61_g5691 [Cercospora zeina]
MAFVNDIIGQLATSSAPILRPLTTSNGNRLGTTGVTLKAVHGNPVSLPDRLCPNEKWREALRANVMKTNKRLLVTTYWRESLLETITCLKQQRQSSRSSAKE